MSYGIIYKWNTSREIILKVKCLYTMESRSSQLFTFCVFESGHAHTPKIIIPFIWTHLINYLLDWLLMKLTKTVDMSEMAAILKIIRNALA